MQGWIPQYTPPGPWTSTTRPHDAASTTRRRRGCYNPAPATSRLTESLISALILPVRNLTARLVFPTGYLKSADCKLPGTWSPYSAGLKLGGGGNAACSFALPRRAAIHAPPMHHARGSRVTLRWRSRARGDRLCRLCWLDDALSTSLHRRAFNEEDSSAIAEERMTISRWID